jgi:hypothetical protein
MPSMGSRVPARAQRALAGCGRVPSADRRAERAQRWLPPGRRLHVRARSGARTEQRHRRRRLPRVPSAWRSCTWLGAPVSSETFCSYVASSSWKRTRVMPHRGGMTVNGPCLDDLWHRSRRIACGDRDARPLFGFGWLQLLGQPRRSHYVLQRLRSYEMPVTRRPLTSPSVDEAYRFAREWRLRLPP